MTNKKEVRLRKEGGGEMRKGEVKEVQGEVSGAKEKKQGKGVEKENIPPVSKHVESPKGKERL